jgi:signal peptidase I
MIREAHLEVACCDLWAAVVRDAGFARLKVTGLSMLPAIWPGDVLLVRGRPSNLLQPGQVLLYQRNGRLTAHRIIRIVGGRLLTRGDCVSSFDEPVQASEIVGQVVGITRNGRAVKLEPSLVQRVAAWVLRHSEACTRILLHLNGAAKRIGQFRSDELPPLLTTASFVAVTRHRQTPD